MNEYTSFSRNVSILADVPPDDDLLSSKHVVRTLNKTNINMI
jgi:hypothetical protein